MMQHGTPFLVALLVAVVFFSWPHHRPAARTRAPAKKPRDPRER
jgi:hypothetical protein